MKGGVEANINGNAPTDGVEDLWENGDAGPTATGSKRRRGKRRNDEGSSGLLISQTQLDGERTASNAMRLSKEKKLVLHEISLIGGEEDSQFRDDVLLPPVPQNEGLLVEHDAARVVPSWLRPTRLLRQQRDSTVVENQQPGAQHVEGSRRVAELSDLQSSGTPSSARDDEATRSDDLLVQAHLVQPNMVTAGSSRRQQLTHGGDGISGGLQVQHPL